jgi:short-subunit dehydrogenase
MAHLNGKVIIITGASSGIGAATAIECARAGMNVLLTARRADKLKIVADEIGKLGRRAEIVVGCVTEPGMAHRLLDQAQESFGQFDAVFANAGYGLECPMHRMSAHELREMFEVNFFSGVDLLQAASARLLAKRRSGHLLMCSSCLAKLTIPYHGAYGATKAAQNHVCRAMEAELKASGIHVSSVHPVTTTTEFFDVSALRSGLLDDHPLGSDHAPRFFRQSPQRVALAVVKCLKHPTPEVWTSFMVRLGAGLMTISPRLSEIVMGFLERSRRQAMNEVKDLRTPNLEINRQPEAVPPKQTAGSSV